MSRLTTDETMSLLVSHTKSGALNAANIDVFMRNPRWFRTRGPGDGTYPIVVDYSDDPDMMYAACRFGVYSVRDQLLDRPGACSGNGRVLLISRLISFDEDKVRTEVVLDALKAQDLRPSKLSELLAFGATYPDVHREYQCIVALETRTVLPRSDSREPEVEYPELAMMMSKPQYLRVLHRDLHSESLGWKKRTFFMGVREVYEFSV